MARPREFDREGALDLAMEVFWAKGYSATSTEDLLQAMGIGRQSLYNAFGDKRRLYLEAIETYGRRTTAAHIKRLSDSSSPLEGIRALLEGLVVDDDTLRAMGCMGVGSIGEFGVSDSELAALRGKDAPLIWNRLFGRVREGQVSGEIDPALDPAEAAGFVLLAMSGIQLAARGGAGAEGLRRMAHFAADRLSAR